MNENQERELEKVKTLNEGNKELMVKVNLHQTSLSMCQKATPLKFTRIQK